MDSCLKHWQRRRALTVPLAGVVMAMVVSVALSSAQAPPAFLPPVTYDLGGPDTRGLVCADLDGDGRPDLAATLFRDTEDDGLSILFGDGRGAFPGRTSFPAGYRAYGLAAADLDGDGLTDLVSTEGTQTKPAGRAPCGEPISVPLFLNGVPSPGQFSLLRCLTAGTFPIAIASGDFNGDSITDLAVVGNVSDDVTVLLGTGTGDFVPGFNTGPLLTRPEGLVLGDWDGDGILDVAVCHQDSFAGRGITALRGTGDGTFTVTQAVFTGSSARAVRAADLNGDGHLDLVCADQGGGRIVACLGRADGTFADGTAAAAGPYPHDLAVADFDGDGRPDIATANSGGDDSTLLLGNGDGTFAPGGTLPAGTEPQAIVAADLDGDGLPDIAISSRNAGEQGTVAVLLQSPRPTFRPGDCDGDGTVTIGEVQGAVGMYLGLQAPSCGVDCDAGGEVSIGEVQKVVNAFLGLPAAC